MKSQHLVLILVINLVWGLNLVVAKLAFEVMPPFWFMSLRFLILGVLLLPWLKIRPGQMRTLLGVSLVGGTLHYGILFWGLDLAGNVSAVAIASQLNVPIAALFSFWFLGETLSGRRLAGMGVAFSGVLLVGLDPAVVDDLAAFALIALAATCYASSFVMMRRLRGVTVLEQQGWLALVSGPALLPD